MDYNEQRQKEVFGFSQSDVDEDMRYTPVRKFYARVGFVAIILVVIAIIAASVYVFSN